MARFALSTNRPEFLQERHGLDTPAFRSAQEILWRRRTREDRRALRIYGVTE